MSLNPTNLDLSTIDLLPRAEDVHVHFVELYEEDDALIESVGRFVSTGIEAGEAAVVVVMERHARSLERTLEGSIDLPAAREAGLYRLVVAEHMLELIMDDWVPRAEWFEREVGGLIEVASRGGRRVRIFGEMVALLWAKGNVGGALRLEDLWNSIAARHEFSLFCAYPASAFGEQNMSLLRAVCSRHSHVIAPPRG
jgi:hypothetical protein